MLVYFLDLFMYCVPLLVCINVLDLLFFLMCFFFNLTVALYYCIMLYVDVFLDSRYLKQVLNRFSLPGNDLRGRGERKKKVMNNDFQ